MQQELKCSPRHSTSFRSLSPGKPIPGCSVLLGLRHASLGLAVPPHWTTSGSHLRHSQFRGLKQLLLGWEGKCPFSFGVKESPASYLISRDFVQTQ